MPRFLHTADWQIGRQYGQFEAEDSVPLAEARITVVEKIAELATREHVDAVLVAGDVFDAQTVADRTIRRLFNALSAFAGPWILIPGNHDAALVECVWQRALRLGVIPPNVHVLLEPGLSLFEEQGFAVLAAPLTQRHTYNDLTEFFDTATTPSGLLRIGLAHGGVQGILADGIDSANPIAPDRVQRAGLDYLALGDWHGTKQIDARTWYSGTPEQDRFKNNDAGQVLLVDIDAPGAEPRVTPKLLGQFRWQTWEETLQVDSDIDRLIENLMAITSNDVVAIKLDGQVDLAGRQRFEIAVQAAQARARSLQVDLSALRLQPTDADVAGLHAYGYLGEVITDLRDRQSGDEAETAIDALALLASLLMERQSQGESA